MGLPPAARATSGKPVPSLRSVTVGVVLDKLASPFGLAQVVKNLSEGTKSHQPDIPWKQIAGMRDKVIYDYFGVNLEIVWAVVQKELPKLAKATANLLKPE